MLITTGCPSLDQLLNGGLITGQLTEVCGPPAAGKTQVRLISHKVDLYLLTIMVHVHVLQLCLCVTGSVVMTTNSSVVYVDSGCSYSSTRLMQILSSKGLKEEARHVPCPGASSDTVSSYYVIAVCGWPTAEDKGLSCFKHL